jgi:hypothetical protein
MQNLKQLRQYRHVIRNAMAKHRSGRRRFLLNESHIKDKFPSRKKIITL